MIANKVIEQAPALETIECHSCGQVSAPDGKCLNPDCETAAEQHTLVGHPNESVLAQPSAWTIRGGVD